MPILFYCISFVLLVVKYSYSSLISTMNTKPVVIIGGGIHGASIAYNLSLKGVKVVIIESTMIAAAASGKAGGFLARNMGYGITKELHEKSFDLHEQLAHTLSLKTYRKIPTIALDGSRNGKQKIASWLDRKVSSQLMSLEADTAQVTPKELTEAFVNHAVSHGAEVIIGKTEDIIKDGGKVTSVIVNGKEIQCSSLIVAMGIWSQPFLADNFNLHIPMEGIKSTSIIINDVKEIRDEPYACFCEEDVNHCHLELYPRSNGDLYICGLGGSDYVSGDRLRDGGDCASADMIKGMIFSMIVIVFTVTHYSFTIY